MRERDVEERERQERDIIGVLWVSTSRYLFVDMKERQRALARGLMLQNTGLLLSVSVCVCVCGCVWVCVGVCGCVGVGVCGCGCGCVCVCERERES